MAAGPEVLLQLTPRTDELALALIPRAGDVGTVAVVAEVTLERVPRHELVAVGVVWAHHGQLVKNVPHKRRGAPYVGVSVQLDPVRRTRLLHAHVRAETNSAEGVGAWSVHRVNQGLAAHLTQEVLVYVVRVVVEMVLARLVALSAHFAHHDVAHPPYLEATCLSPQADSPGGLDASRLCSCHLYWLDSATTKKASAVYLR